MKAKKKRIFYKLVNLNKSMFKFLLSENQQLMNLPSKILYHLAR